MKKALVLLCALTAVAAFGKDRRTPREDSSRPLLHMRYIVGTVPVGDATDIYWESVNELVDPIHTTLFRTRIGADGLPQGSTTVVRENYDYFSTQVASTASTAIAIWHTGTELRASPISNGRLRYPDGKFIARHVLYPAISCAPGDCAVAWESGGMRVFAMLDNDANVVAGPFGLPHGFAPSRMMLNGLGIFYVRHTLAELRAALILRNGKVHYDAVITEANPLNFNTTPVGLAFDGLRYVVSFLDKAKAGGELRIVRVTTDGALSQETRILDTDARGLGLTSLSLGWNGESYLLTGSYVLNAHAFVVQLDYHFARAAQQPPAAIAGASVLRVIGEDFLMGSSSDNRPSVFVVRADGQTTAPVLLREPSRRRAVR